MVFKNDGFEEAYASVEAWAVLMNGMGWFCVHSSGILSLSLQNDKMELFVWICSVWFLEKTKLGEINNANDIIKNTKQVVMLILFFSFIIIIFAIFFLSFRCLKVDVKRDFESNSAINRLTLQACPIIFILQQIWEICKTKSYFDPNINSNTAFAFFSDH